MSHWHLNMYMDGAMKEERLGRGESERDFQRNRENGSCPSLNAVTWDWAVNRKNDDIPLKYAKEGF